MRALKMEEHSGLPLESDKDQLRGSSELILLKLQKVLLKNSMLTIQQLKQIGKMKKLDRWMPHELTLNKKKRNNFKVSSSHFVQQRWTISQLDCDVRQKVDFMTVSGDQLSGWTKKLQSTSKSQTCTQKRSWSLFGDLLLNFGDLEFSESWQNHYMWEVCSANRWDAPKTEHTCCQHRSTERSQFFSMTTPGHMMYNQCFRSWANWSMKFCLVCHTYRLTSRHWLPLLQTPLQLFAGMCFHI